MFHVPDIPLHEAGWVFALLFAVMLVVPIVAERARLPSVVGLVLAGTVIGPNVMGLLEREGAVELLGSAGLLYLMFLAGLELDLDQFLAHRRDALIFGATTFVIPMAISTAVIVLLGFSTLSALLLGSCWASHTLLTYPTFRHFNTQNNRAVATSVGATIITDTVALLALVIVVRAHDGNLDAGFWVSLTVALGTLGVTLLVLLPAAARWFFTGIGHDRAVRFGFMLTALFLSSGLAELAGIEAIIGAFLAGLALNKLVANGSQLMEQLEFLGSQLLIPLFLISVGMLVDPSILSDPETLGHAAAFIALALGTKWLAAQGTGRFLGYEGVERSAMFALSGAQAAATLAVVIVGFNVGLIDANTVNAVILVILATCVVTAAVAGRAAPRLTPPDRPQFLGDVVVVSTNNPASRGALLRLAATMAAPDKGTVVPLTVVPPEANPKRVNAARESTLEAEALALKSGAEAEGTVRIDGTPAAGILHTLVEHNGSLVVLGWKGHSSAREALFGSTLDVVLGEARVPLLIGRLGGDRPTGLLLALSEVNATPAGLAGFQLALQATDRMARRERLEVRVISTVDDPILSRAVKAVLGVDMFIDERRRAVAVRDHVNDGDRVVVPILPDRSGMRRVAQRVARSIPDHDILIAFDAGSPAVALEKLSGAEGPRRTEGPEPEVDLEAESAPPDSADPVDADALADNVLVRDEPVLLVTRGGANSIMAAQIVDLAWPKATPVTLVTVRGGDSGANVQVLSDVLYGRQVDHRELQSDDLAEALSAEAALGYGIAAIGTSRPSESNGSMLSGVAEEVVLHSPVPVLLVRRGFNVRGRLPGAYQRVLIPVAGTDSSRAALEVGLNISAGIGTEAVLTHIVHRADAESSPRVPVPSGAGPGRAVPTVRAVGHQLLDAATAQAYAMGARPLTALHEADNTGSGILEIARLHHTDLVIVGAKRRNIDGKLFLGPTVDRLLRQCQATMVVVVSGPGRGER